jgi:hypothetical protein
MEENLKTSIFNPKDKLNESANFNEKNLFRICTK